MKSALLRIVGLGAVVFIILMLLFPTVAQAGDVALKWNSNSESDLGGYKIYFGTASRTYRAPVVVGKQTSYTLSQLPAGKYYFAVTAYNAAGLESAFSNEVSAVVASTGTTCEVNFDSSANVLDLQALSNVALGARTCPGSCDIDKDTRVDALDLQVLASAILGLRSCS
jgi:Fibronectin type III domain/Dockerin type I domain